MALPGVQAGWRARSMTGRNSQNQEGYQTRLWCQDSCEGKVQPSDRDQGQTEPRDCQPVHGDESRAQPPWSVRAMALHSCNHTWGSSGGDWGRVLSWDGDQGRVGGGGPAGLLLPSVPCLELPPRQMCPLNQERRGLWWDLLKGNLVAEGCRGHTTTAGTWKWERDRDCWSQVEGSGRPCVAQSPGRLMAGVSDGP